MRSYTTVQGDTWDIISLKMYGTEKNMDTIIDANSVHRETVVFSAGAVIAVPNVLTSAIPTNVPPWKRGV